SFPNDFTTPRTRRRFGNGCRAGWNWTFPRQGLNRVEICDDVAALGAAVHPPVCVNRWIALVGGGCVVHVVGGSSPIPQRDNQVAFDPAGSGWLHLWQRARRDAIGPIGKHRAL